MEKYIKIIQTLNEELDEKMKTFDHGFYFSYSTEGYIHMIEFMNELLWDSENEGRKFDKEKNEYEPLMPYIKRKFNDYVDELNKIKFEI